MPSLANSFLIAIIAYGGTPSNALNDFASHITNYFKPFTYSAKFTPILLAISGIYSNFYICAYSVYTFYSLAFKSLALIFSNFGPFLPPICIPVTPSYMI